MLYGLITLLLAITVADQEEDSEVVEVEAVEDAVEGVVALETAVVVVVDVEEVVEDLVSVVDVVVVERHHSKVKELHSKRRLSGTFLFNSSGNCGLCWLVGSGGWLCVLISFSLLLFVFDDCMTFGVG